jgi:hypothetical protein
VTTRSVLHSQIEEMVCMLIAKIFPSLLSAIYQNLFFTLSYISWQSRIILIVDLPNMKSSILKEFSTGHISVFVLTFSLEEQTYMLELNSFALISLALEAHLPRSSDPYAHVQFENRFFLLMNSSLFLPIILFPREVINKELGITSP